MMTCVHFFACHLFITMAIFGSLNINGGASQSRMLQVVNLIKQRKLDVAFLQETHSTPASHSVWNRMMKKTGYFSDSNSRTAGVAFLLSPHFCPLQLSFQEIIPGYLASLDFVDNNIEFTFNCTLQPARDRNGAEPHPGSARLLSDIIRDFSLQDIWRIQNPNTHQFTWSKVANNQVALARLDRFYINSPLINLSPTTRISPSGFSDHHLITMCYRIGSSPNRHSFWKLNISILDNPSFNSAFQSVWSNLVGAKPQFKDQRLWWDNTKVQIRNFCQHFCSLNTQVERRIKAELEKEILQIQSNLKTHPAPQQKLRLHEKKSLLNSIITNHTQGALTRLRFQHLHLLDNPTRFF